MEAGSKINIQPRVIAEISKAQVGQMHVFSMASGSPASEIFHTETAGFQPATDSRAADLSTPSAGWKPRPPPFANRWLSHSLSMNAGHSIDARLRLVAAR